MLSLQQALPPRFQDSVGMISLDSFENYNSPATNVWTPEVLQGCDPRLIKEAIQYFSLALQLDPECGAGFWSGHVCSMQA